MHGIELNESNIKLAAHVAVGDLSQLHKKDPDFQNLFMSYAQDKNSSTLRERVSLSILGYESFSAKHGADGYDPVTNRLKEVKPIQSTGIKAIGSTGGFNDLTIELLEKKKDYDIICSLFCNFRLIYLVDFLDIGSKVTLICDDVLNMRKYNLPMVDMVLTSPPYFDLEVYTDESTQSINNTATYQQWADKFLLEVIKLGIDHLSPGGVSCWNVGKVGKNDMNDDVLKYHAALNFAQVDALTVTSSKRQSIQSESKNSKSLDNTNIFKKIEATPDTLSDTASIS